MIRFTGTVDGIEALNRGFNRVSDLISDFRSIWPGVIRVFYEIELEQFSSEGSRGASGKWAALSLAYKRFKEVAFPGQSILQADGDLFESLTSPEAFGAVIRPEANELTLGTTIPYALAHHRGAPGRNLPARPVISLTEDDKRRMQKEIQRGLVRFIRQAGFHVEEIAA